MAGSVVQAVEVNPRRTVAVVTIDWTGDAANGSVPDTPLSGSVMGAITDHFLYTVTTDPGSPAPTDNYDVTLVDGAGFDILGGSGADRDAANSERALPKVGTDRHYPLVHGALTFKLANNSVASAKGRVVLVFVKDRPL